MRFVHIQNETVVEAIEATPDWIQQLPDAHNYIQSDTIGIGYIWNGAAYIPNNTPDFNIMWTAIRRARDGLLATCDWTVLPDSTVTNKQAWITYRQALRDLTNYASPLQVIWPAQPQ